MVRPADRKIAARAAISKFGLKHRRACRVFELNRFTWWYQPRPDRNVELRSRLRELSAQNPAYGLPMLHDILRKEWKEPLNRKRTERVYRLEGLSLRKKKRNRKKLGQLRLALPAATGRDEVWAIDFIFDRLSDGRVVKTMTMIDHCTREIPDLIVAGSIRGSDVAATMERLRILGRKPKVLVVDNGPEFRSRALFSWATRHHVRLHFIEPGKPTQNAYIESLNGKFRAECLAQNLFETTDSARLLINAWRKGYETRRPHSSLGGLTPAEFCQKLQAQQREKCA